MGGNTAERPNYHYYKTKCFFLFCFNYILMCCDDLIGWD